MIFKHLRAFLAIAAGCLLVGCHSELQFDNLDPTMEAQVKLALPIGTIKAKVSDFLKANDSLNLTMDSAGIYTWKMEFSRSKQFDYFDLANKLQDSEFKVNLYKQLEDKTFYNPVTHENQSILRAVSALGIKDEIFLPYGCEFKDTFRFNMPMELAGINLPSSKTRVDSAYLPKASFKITITKDNFEGLDWNWINMIKLDLGDFIVRHNDESNEVILYKKGDPITSPESMNWNLDLGAVTLNLMVEPDRKPQDYEVYNEVTFPVEIVYEIPPGNTYMQPTRIAINENSGISCNFKKDELKVKAVWGWFESTQNLQAGDTVDISSQLGSIPFLKNASFPLANPLILADLKTKVAGDVRINGTLAAIDDDNSAPRYAIFDGMPFFDWKYQYPDCASPKGWNFGDSTKIHMSFDNTPEHGHIDELFVPMPSKIAFDVTFNFDKKSTPQVRVTDDLFFDFKAAAILPLTFKDGLKINYVDTMSSIAISQMQIDSLAPVIDSVHVNSAHLFMNIEDSIPLDLYVTFYCLNERGDKIMSPKNSEKIFTLFPQDTIFIAGATYQGGQLVAQKTFIQCELTQDELDLFPKIKSIIYTIGATAPKDGEKKGTEIKGSNCIKIGLGLTADVNAIINPSKGGNK